MTGHILKDTATKKFLHVIRGVAAKGHALQWEPIFPVFIVRKRMFMSRIFMVGNILGWASPISTLKGHSCGATEHHLTSNTGRNTSQTTFTTKIVYILLDSFKGINTNGTISIAQTATDSPARKV